jgi:hypothetical protein
LARCNPKNPTPRHQAHRLDDHRAPADVPISRTKSPFFRKSGAAIANLRNAARSLVRCVIGPLFLTKKGVVFVARRAQEGSSWTPPGPTLLRHAQKGLHLSTLCFTFPQAPVFGVEYGQVARRAGQSGGPEHGSKEEEEGRCEA